ETETLLTTAPFASVTNALTAVDNVPSPLLLACNGSGRLTTMFTAGGGDVGVIVGVLVDVEGTVGGLVGSGGVRGVLVNNGVFVGVAVGRRSGRTMVLVVGLTPSTRATTVIVEPARLCTYFTQDSASPGCGTTVKPRLHGAAIPVKPGLVTET